MLWNVTKQFKYFTAEGAEELRDRKIGKFNHSILPPSLRAWGV